MTVTILACIAKLPSLTTEQFKERYEEHIQIVQRLFGDAFPLVNRRCYNVGAWSSEDPEVGYGGQSNAGYDCYTFNIFRDQQHLEDCLSKYQENHEVIAADEAFFSLREQGIVLYMDIQETLGKAWLTPALFSVQGLGKTAAANM